MHILILEDEQAAGEKLLHFIREVADNATTTWLRSIAETLNYLKEDAGPDLIFSDIELLDGNVFKVFEQITPACPIIFCTAYDRFFLDAFRTNGIAYLLKPYTHDQFSEAWKKYMLLFNHAKSEQSPLTPQILESLKSVVGHKMRTYKKRFTIKKRNGVFLLAVDDIAYFKSQSDFVMATSKNNRRHIINDTMANIEEQIDPVSFFRINRSEIVSIDTIIKFEPYRKNRLAVTLNLPETVLYTSNSRAAEFRSWVAG